MCRGAITVRATSRQFPKAHLMTGAAVVKWKLDCAICVIYTQCKLQYIPLI